ncbi:sensor histidine kinase [Longispora albida]|uniref:sensor histidine kinase n=1 Tax=Longispora albida TaxID=203523 RepID=UPI00039A373D|nr:histidine kinase [Longispora albida]
MFPRWALFLVYGAVLLAGLLPAGDAGPRSPVLFGAALAALAGLELLPAEPRTWRAAGLLVARVILTGAVVAGDGSGLSEVLFALVPFAGYLAFGRWAGAGLAAGCLGLAAAARYGSRDGMADLVMLGLGLALVMALAESAAAERAARERLARYAARIGELSAQAERNRLSREIHDDLGQHLTTVTLLLDQAVAFSERDPEVSRRALADARHSAREALADVRHSLTALREGIELPSALRGLEALPGPPAVRCVISGDHGGWDPATLLTVYRIAQEGVTNARRHAGATTVDVEVSFAGRAAELTVTDDGPGIGGPEGGGLRGIRERVALAGGELRITGSQLAVTIPAGGGA